jgi:hypothetical protein
MQGWVDPRVGLDSAEKRKILLCRQSNPRNPARSPLLYGRMTAEGNYFFCPEKCMKRIMYSVGNMHKCESYGNWYVCIDTTVLQMVKY